MLAGALVILLAGGALFSFRSQARAEDSSGGDQNSVSSTQASENEREQAKQEAENEKTKKESEDVVETEDNEDGVNNQLDNLSSSASSTLSTLAEVNSDNFSTYGDVLAVLQNFSTTLDQLASQANVTSSLEVGLSQQEMDLLSSLVSKHKMPSIRLAARVQEIKDQMKAVSDLLAPLSSVDISPLLRKPLVSMLKDFREEIKSLGELEHLNYDIFDFETSN